MTTVTLTQIVCGLGMISGVIVTILGYFLGIHAVTDNQKDAANSIALMGLVTFTITTLIWSIEVFQWI